MRAIEGTRVDPSEPSEMSVHKLEMILAVLQKLRNARVSNDVELSDQDLNRLARVCVACSTCDVAAMYDPVWGAWLGTKSSFRPGFCMDVSTRIHSEKFWDPCRDDDVEELTRVQEEEEKPWLVMESPPCVTFRNLRRPTCPDKAVKWCWTSEAEPPCTSVCGSIDTEPMPLRISKCERLWCCDHVCEQALWRWQTACPIPATCAARTRRMRGIS